MFDRFSSFHGTLLPSVHSLSFRIHRHTRSSNLFVSSVAPSPPYDLSSFEFDPIKESIVSCEMIQCYMMNVITYVNTNVVIVWAGFSCTYELSKNPDVNIAIISGQLFSVMANVVVSSCGHDGPFGAIVVKRLKNIGMIDSIPGMKALDKNTVEDAIVRLTREIVPERIVTRMEVTEMDGAPRHIHYVFTIANAHLCEIAIEMQLI